MKSNYGNGSVKQRSAGSFQLRWHVASEGKYHTKTIRCNSEHQAWKELRQVLAQQDMGNYIAPSKLTIKDAIEKYNEHKRNHVRTKTHQEYVAKTNLYIIPNFGHYKIDTVKPAQLQQWFDSALSNGRQDGTGGLSPRTLVHVRTILKACFQYFVDNGDIKNNPAVKIRVPTPRPYKAETLTAEEILILLNSIKGSKYEMAVWLVIFTGCRRGEALGLTWDCVDFNNSTITIRQTLDQIAGSGLEICLPKTDDSIRVIYIEDTLIQILKSHKENQEIQKLRIGEIWENTNAVCSNERGGWLCPNSFSWMFKELRVKAGITKHIRLHDTRHTHNSILAPHMPMKTLMDRMGWSSPDIMMRIYTHTTSAQGREAADKFAEILKTASQHN